MRLSRFFAALVLLLLSTLPGNAIGPWRGGAPSGGGAQVLLGTMTDVNAGAAESNVPRRRAFAFSRGQMPTVGGTNGSSSGSNTFTDTTCNCFYPQDVGLNLNITSPGSGLTTGQYTIASVPGGAASSTVILTPAPGVSLGTGSGASWMASTTVGSGYTFRLVDCNGNNLVYGQDQIATFDGMAGSTDVQDVRHVVFSYIEPSIGANGTTCPVSIYRVAGTYSPGTALPISAVTAATNLIDYFGSSSFPVEDASFTVQGSGQYQFAFNTYATQPLAANFGSTGLPGGYRVWIQNQDETCWSVLGAMTDVSTGTAHPWLAGNMWVCAWQTTPGSGVLGYVEVLPEDAVPWQTNPGTATAPSSYFGYRAAYDGSTQLRTWQQTYTFGPSNVTPGATLGYGSGGPGTFTSNPGIQQGEPYIFNVTGGGSNALPGGINTGQIYFVNDFNVNNVISPFWLSLNPNLWGGVGSGYGTEAVTSMTWSSTNGGQVAVVMAAPSIFQLGDTIPVNGVTNTGSGSVSLINTSQVINTWTDSQHFTFLLPGTTQWGTLGGTISLSTGYTGLVNPRNSGTCASGNCFTMTRVDYINVNTAEYLPADDQGDPFWIKGGVVGRTAVLVPQPTMAEITAMEQTGIIPPFALTPPTAPSSPPLVYPTDWMASLFGAPGGSGTTQPNLQPTGPGYRPNGLGVEPISIGNGGVHPGIGVMSDWVADEIKAPSVANWGYVQATALARNSFFTGYVLNSATGYLTPYDDGPNGAGASYPTLGAPHPNDYNYDAYDASSNFPMPVTPNAAALSPACATISCWYEAISGGLASSETGTEAVMDHLPSMGQAFVYMLTGNPWDLDEVNQAANYVQTVHVPVTGTPNDGGRGPFTIGSNTYSGRVVWGSAISEAPRWGAWGLRSLTNGASLGADGNPEKIYAWMDVRSNIREAYDFSKNYQTNASFAALGETTEAGWIPPFQNSYAGMVAASMQDRFRQTESSLSGASTLYDLNYFDRFNIGLLNSAGFGPRWAFGNDYTVTLPYAANTNSVSSPWISSFPQSFFAGGIATCQTIDYTGLCTSNSYYNTDGTWGQYEQPGDEIVQYVLSGGLAYYVCNFTTSGAGVTFQTSVNSSCSPIYTGYGASFSGSISGNTVTPSGAVTGTVAIGQNIEGAGVAAATITFINAGPTYTISGSPQTVALEAMTTQTDGEQYLIRPTNPSSPLYTQNFPQGNIPLDMAAFRMGVGAGATEPGLSTALSYATTEYNSLDTLTTGYYYGGCWMMWDMQNVTVN